MLIAKEGKTIYRKAFGKANLELAVDMDPNQVFAIGSITKQFTACAILKLAEEGTLSLQDPITTFIPDYPTHGHLITLEHLLTHSAGIKSITEMKKWTLEVQKRDFSPKELINFIKDEPVEFTPGEQFHYSNSGYILLGHIVEVVTGKSYAQYLNETFFTPLGLSNTRYSTHSGVVLNRATGYQKDKGFYENADYLSVTQPYAAGSILSTADDLYRWYEAVMSNRVISLQSVRQAHTPYRLKNGTAAPYGYGWRLGNVQESPSVKHGGQVNGYAAFSLYLPQEKVFVAILTNCDCNADLEDIASKLAAIAIGKPYFSNKHELTPIELASYTGIYESETRAQQQIVNYENGRLMYYPPKGRKAELFPYERDRFRLAHSLTSVAFTRDAGGKVVALTERSTGLPNTWTRTPKLLDQRTVIKVAEKVLGAYVGHYQFKPGVAFAVSQQAGKLYGQLLGPGQTKQELIPYRKHKFYARYTDATVEFEVGKHDKVKSLTLVQNEKKTALKVE